MCLNHSLVSNAYIWIIEFIILKDVMLILIGGDIIRNRYMCTVKKFGILSNVFVRFFHRINHTISSFILSGPRYLTQNFRDGVFFYAIWTMMTKPELEIKLRPQVFVCQKKIAKLCVHNAWVWVVQRCFSIFALKKVVGEQISWGRKVSSD